jgi:SNF2 family DNA or RNA helicase
VDVELSPGMQSWYEETVAKERALIQLKSVPDVTFDTAAEKLWPFQRVGVNYLRHAKRVILADAPGLGKTATTINAVRLEKQQGRVLILCPSSLKYWWESEIKRWHPGSPVVVVRSDKEHREKDLAQFFTNFCGYMIVNWEAVRLMPQLGKRSWKWLICDEAHRLKNRQTLLYSCVKDIKSEFLTLVTATPMGNDVTELWTLLHLIDPVTYSSFWRFFGMYARTNSWDKYQKVIGVKHPELLARELAPLMIRRSKEECGLQLPPKIFTEIRLSLTEKQMQMYRDMAKTLQVELSTGDVLEAPQTLTCILRLRQILSTTRTLDPAIDDSCKLDAVCEMIADMPDEHFVVFSMFRPTVECLEDRLRKMGVSVLTILGGIGSEEMNARKDRFQNGEARVLVATLMSGGVGLTLTRAAKLIFIDKHYNPMQQEQSMDRIHRIGQTRTCEIISLRVPHSADDMVEDILAGKLRTATELYGALEKHIAEVLQEE